MKVIDEVRRYGEEGPRLTADDIATRQDAFMASTRVRDAWSASVVELRPEPAGTSSRLWKAGAIAASVAVITVTAVALTTGTKVPIHNAVKLSPKAVVPTSIKARLMDALVTNAGDVLEDYQTIDQAGAPSCPTINFTYPFVPVDGQPFQMISTSQATACPGPQQVIDVSLSSATVQPLSTTPDPYGGFQDVMTVTGPGTTEGYNGTTRQWWDGTTEPGPSGPTSTLRAFATVSPTALQQQLANHDVTIVGAATVAGKSTVELTIGTTAEGNWVKLYVDPQTYLPVEEVQHSGYGEEAHRFWTDTVDAFTFMNPTNANLANFNVQTPAGFTQVAQQPDASGLAITPSS